MRAILEGPSQSQCFFTFLLGQLLSHVVQRRNSGFWFGSSIQDGSKYTEHWLADSTRVALIERDPRALELLILDIT